MKSKRRANAGFTLIELVIVITIIGILAAFALPKFVALQTDARMAKLKAARGTVAAAAGLVHSAYLARAGVEDEATCGNSGIKASNLGGDVFGTVCTEGGLIQIYRGYPSSPPLGGTTAGLISAAGLSGSSFTPNLKDLNAEGIGAVIDGATGMITISVIGGATTVGTSAAGYTNPDCSFVYTPPAAAGAAPTISTLTTTGC